MKEKEIFPVSTILGKNYPDFNTFIQDYSEDDLKTLKSFQEESQLAGIPLSETQLLAPIRQPLHDILCVGVNYAAHAEEAGHSLADATLEAPQQVVLFGKRAEIILGPDEQLVPRYDLDPEVDYEGELAVVIGKEGKDITVDRALEYVFGYSVFNDFSSRRLQRAHNQWLKGKSLDGYSAMGPVIITKDAFSLDEPHLITTTVNGELRQKAPLSDMINTVPEIIAALSAGITLHPGDIIATGTPAGVAMGMTAPRWLQPGDQVVCSIDGIGQLPIQIG